MNYIGRYGARFSRFGLLEYEVKSVNEVLDPEEDLEIDPKKWGLRFALLNYLKEYK